MIIKKIILKNYRGFSNAEFCFNDSVNVIYGKNGTGKSTIVYAISDICFAMAQKNGIPSKTIILPSNRFNDPTKDCSIGIEFLYDGKEYKFFLNRLTSDYGKDEIFNPNQQQTDSLVNLFIEGNKLADGTFCTGDIDSIKDINIIVTSLIPGNIENKIEAVQDFTKGFMLKIENSPRFAVVKGIRNFEQLKNIFEHLEGIELQKRLGGDPSYRDPFLQKIRTTLVKLSPHFGEIKIDRTLQGNPLMVEKNHRFLNVATQLSDGEAGIIGILCLIIGIISQTKIDMFPIIVDEIDNCLHPSWQSQILLHLEKIFPDNQIIATSHSPFVWAELKRENIIHLVSNSNGDIHQEDVNYAIGGSLDTIITDFFDVGLYSNNIIGKFREIEQLISKKDFDTATNALSDLENEFGELPVFVKLQMKIRALSR